MYVNIPVPWSSHGLSSAEVVDEAKLAASNFGSLVWCLRYQRYNYKNDRFDHHQSRALTYRNAGNNF